MPSTRRVLGESHEVTFRARTSYGEALYKAPAATLDDLCEAVEVLEETTRTARRVLGSAHPITNHIEVSLKHSRVVLATRETPPAGSV